MLRNRITSSLLLTPPSSFGGPRGTRYTTVRAGLCASALQIAAELGQQVRSCMGAVSPYLDDVVCRLPANPFLQISRCLPLVLSQVASHETRDKRCCHRGPVHRFVAISSSVNGRRDVHPWGYDVGTGATVRELSECIGYIAGHDGDGISTDTTYSSRGYKTSGSSIITSRDDDGRLL